MDTEALTRMVRVLRADQGLTQEQVAALVPSDRKNRTTISKQAVSLAEQETVGSEMNGLRVKIIEALSGRELEGPYWRFKDESIREVE